MNFNVYVDKETVRRLARLAKARRTTRNALIREALARMLDAETAPTWPNEVLAYSGEPRARRFEASRKDLEAPKPDPFE